MCSYLGYNLLNQIKCLCLYTNNDSQSTTCFKQSLGMMVGIIFSKIDLATNIGATGLVLIMLLCK